MTNQDNVESILGKFEETNALVQEVAEDMEDVLQGMGKLEKRQANLEAKLEQLTQEIAAKAQVDAKELNRLRKDLLEEQDSLMGVGVFNLVVPTLDSLHIMLTSLDETADSRVFGQVQSILVTLENLLRRVNISAFSVEAGEDFDAARMRCEGFIESEILGVVKMTRLGYRIRDKTLREAAVLLNQNLQP